MIYSFIDTLRADVGIGTCEGAGFDDLLEGITTSPIGQNISIIHIFIAIIKTKISPHPPAWPKDSFYFSVAIPVLVH